MGWVWTGLGSPGSPGSRLPVTRRSWARVLRDTVPTARPLACWANSPGAKHSMVVRRAVPAKPLGGLTAEGGGFGNRG